MGDLLDKLSGAQLTGLAAIVCGCMVLALLILAVTWAVVSSTNRTARLKLEMLARGFGVADIERLTASEMQIAARDESARLSREAELNVGLARDLAERGVPAAEIRALTASRSVAEADAAVLAATICGMVQDGELDEAAVAALLRVFLRRGGAPEMNPADLALERVEG